MKKLERGSVTNLTKVDMTHSKITIETFHQKKLLSPTIHPLSKENEFIVAPGLLAGT